MNNEEVLKHKSDFDCGSTAVRFAAAISGKMISSTTANGLCHVDINGTTHGKLIEALETLGLTPKEQVGELKCPCIANCLIAEENEIDGHYIVVISQDDRYILLYDPADGCMKVMRIDDFDRVWRAFRYPPDRWCVHFKLDPSP